MGGTHPTTMLERHAQHSHLTMGGTHTTTMSEKTLTSDHGRNTSNNHVRKASKLISYHGRNMSNDHVRKAQHLYLTMGGTHPTTM